MLTHSIVGPRAWTADTLDNRRLWYHWLSPRCLEGLDRAVADVRRQPRPVTTVNLCETPAAGCDSDLKPALADLEEGRGFVILRGLPADRYSPEDMRLCYWLVGQMLGRPQEQNVQGTLLYDVRDEGQDVRYGARFSVTNNESSFHTDNSFGNELTDYVGLLCLQTAKSGGVNQNVSICSVHNELLARADSVLPLLYGPFHVDRRGGVRPGETPTVRQPVFQWDGSELVVRYLRYWIESGQQKAEQPLTAEQVKAMDALDAAARMPALHAEFALERGDLFFLNNRRLLHNRTAFEDHPEPDRRRHLVRLWLRRNG
jgi:alpha-ketoglutarate-dependent taurine dioxygenase